MSVFFTKVLSLLIYPLTLGLLCLIAGLSVRRWRPRLGLGLSVLGLLILWVPSTPVVSDAFRSALEGQYPPVAMADVPVAEAIVVLGGGVSPVIPPRLTADLDAGADRVLHAARLYRAGKAPLVVATGGHMSWHGNSRPEAIDMRQLLEEWGVPAEAILTETGSQTTYENALGTAALLAERGVGRILLVTSALHMRRALATFRSAGLDAHPAATDYEVVHLGDRSILRAVPDAGNLGASTRAIKEYVGYRVYRWRGWISRPAPGL